MAARGGEGWRQGGGDGEGVRMRIGLARRGGRGNHCDHYPITYTYIYNNICDVYNSNMATLLYCKRDHYGIMDRNEFKY